MTEPEDLPVEDDDEEVDEPDWDGWQAELDAAAAAFKAAGDEGVTS